MIAMDKVIRWVLIGIVLILIVNTFFKNSLSRKAEIDLYKLKSERDQAFANIELHRIKIESLRRYTEVLKASINITSMEIAEKERSLKAMKTEIKRHEQEDINIVGNFNNNELDSCFRAIYTVPDSLYFKSTKTGFN